MVRQVYKAGKTIAAEVERSSTLSNSSGTQQDYNMTNEVELSFQTSKQLLNIHKENLWKQNNIERDIER